jgi:hypothetical protein
MRLVFLALFAVLAVAVVSCKSSTEVNGVYKDYSPHPKVGSYFIYHQDLLDTNGDVRTDGYRTDSVWQVIAADTTMFGRSHVWIFASGDSINSKYLEQMFAIAYLSNNDIAYLQINDDEMKALPDTAVWLTFPTGSLGEIQTTFDSTIEDPKEGNIVIHETIDTKVTHTDYPTIGGSMVQTITMLSAIDADVSTPDTSATLHGTREWTYAPALGFFTAVHDRDFEGYGDRRVLTGYKLK